jgi:uncharacterized protein (DUF1501 family)
MAMKKTAFASPASRRAFLKQAGFLTALGGSPFLANLASIGSAAASTATDHKALVCVFLNGGNDQSNTVVPISSAEYAAYQSARPDLALAQSAVLPLSLQGFSGPQLGLHPQLAGIKSLVDAGACALLANVGTLTQPLTKAQWNNCNPTVPVPFQLFSHSDQQNQWQTGLPDRPSQTGWLGRAGDQLAATYNGASPVSICLSVAGNNMIQAGEQTIQYQLTPNGAVRVNALNGFSWSPQAGTALRRLVTEQRGHRLEAELGRITSRAVASETRVTDALAGVPTSLAAFSGFSTLGSNPLAQQLRMVARMIAASSTLGQRRQIFFVSLGGFDFHDNLADEQPLRLRQVGDAIKAFYDATVALGVANQVTTFTASDFGRALQSNGRGTDHGWGSHHFIVGGAVRGNRLYGQWPTVAIGGPEDAILGRLIPTTSVDQYAATLASWFGATDLDTVVPNIGRFASRNLGFMS